MARRLAAKKEEIFILTICVVTSCKKFVLCKRDFNESSSKKAINDSSGRLKNEMQIGLQLDEDLINSMSILYQRHPSTCRLCKLIQIYSKAFGMWEVVKVDRPRER